MFREFKDPYQFSKYSTIVPTLLRGFKDPYDFLIFLDLLIQKIFFILALLSQKTFLFDW